MLASTTTKMSTSTTATKAARRVVLQSGIIKNNTNKDSLLMFPMVQRNYYFVALGQQPLATTTNATNNHPWRNTTTSRLFLSSSSTTPNHTNNNNNTNKEEGINRAFASARPLMADEVVADYHTNDPPPPSQQKKHSQQPQQPQRASVVVGTIEKPLMALDMAMVRQIKAELMAVDVNADGRLDADELKQLLRKHGAVFTDEEIVEIGELYYAAKAGGSVRFDNFIEAVDRVAAAAAAASSSKATSPLSTPLLFDTEEKGQHFREAGLQRHPLGLGKEVMEFMHAGKSHGHYTAEELNVKLTHVPPVGLRDRLAYNAVKAVRLWFDLFTGWKNEPSKITAPNILNRVIYLETIAAVPGMVAAILRHFRSLRSMKGDGGMLQMFLEEANNERMHLLTFVRMKDPGYLFRAAVILGQFGFGTVFTLAYIVSPKFCHRFVGYIEEEACSTYTKIIAAIEVAPPDSELGKWRTEPAPKIACAYWKLGPHGTVLDLMRAVRADEAEHRDVNHLVSGMQEGQINPLYDPETKLDLMLAKYVRALMTRDGRDDDDDDAHVGKDDDKGDYTINK